MSPHRPLVEVVAGLEAAARAEAEIFEVVGRWVPTVGEPAVKITLSIHSRRHGDHAVALAAVAPQVVAIPPRPPPAPLLGEPLLAAVAGLGTTLARLVALDRVLLTRLARAGAPTGAGPAVGRCGALVAADHQAQAADLGEHLARLLAAAGEAERRAAAEELAALGTVAGEELALPPSNLIGGR